MSVSDTAVPVAATWSHPCTPAGRNWMPNWDWAPSDDNLPSVVFRWRHGTSRMHTSNTTKNHILGNTHKRGSVEVVVTVPEQETDFPVMTAPGSIPSPASLMTSPVGSPSVDA